MALDISDTDVYAALIPFFQLIVPSGTAILRGQQNRVPMPSVPFVLMTALGAPRRIGTNTDDIEATVVDGAVTGFELDVTADFEYSIQADFVSPDAESWAMAVELLWRDKNIWSQLPQGIKPLYSEGRQQLPIIGAEDQWIQRWTMTLVLDYQPTWTQATQAATVASVVGVPVDVLSSVNTADSTVITADSNVTA